MKLRMTIADFFSETGTDYKTAKDIMENKEIEELYVVPLYDELSFENDIMTFLKTKFPDFKLEIEDETFIKIREKIENEIGKIQGDRLASYMFSEFFEEFEEYLTCSIDGVQELKYSFSDGEHYIESYNGFYGLDTAKVYNKKLERLELKIPLENITEIIFDIKDSSKSMKLKDAKSYFRPRYDLLFPKKLEEHLSYKAEDNYDSEMNGYNYDYNDFLSYNLYLLDDISNEKLREIVYNTTT